jgi:homocysteine S-methyltransferase
MVNELRVPVPEDLMERMRKAETAEAARREGVAIARKLADTLRPSIQGIQLSAPFGQYRMALDVIADS